MALPGLIPIFPLPSVVLFPEVPLPLHVFEPRYRDMVRDVQETESGFIGMVLLRGDWRKDYQGCPDVFATGCAGRVVQVAALPDGRFNILLQGFREFEMLGEDRSKTYRLAEVRWRPDGAETLPAGFRAKLRTLVARFADRREPGFAGKLFDDPSLSDGRLINWICSALEFSALEKQALLEARSLAERGTRLCEVIQFALDAGAERGAPADGWRH